MDVVYFKSQGLTLTVGSKRKMQLEVTNIETGMQTLIELRVLEACRLAQALARAGLAMTEMPDNPNDY